VEKDCQACGLNTEDAIDCIRWMMWIRAIDDHDRPVSEWVNVSSVTSLPRLSWTISGGLHDMSDDCNKLEAIQRWSAICHV